MINILTGLLGMLKEVVKCVNHAIKGPSNPEIGQLGGTVLIKKYIGGFDVSVDDVARVYVFQ